MIFRYEIILVVVERLSLGNGVVKFKVNSSAARFKFKGNGTFT